MSPGRAAAVLATASCLISLAGMEGILRLTFPRAEFMEQADDDYWLAQIADGLKSGSSSRALNVVHDSRIGWLMRPDWSTDGVAHNNAGYRGARPFHPNKEPNVNRMVLLGDSFTYGLGVDDDQTFGALMQAELGPNTEVVNAGVNSWGMGQMLLFFRERVRALEPDTIALTIYVDDFNRAGLIARDFLKPRYVPRGDELVLVATPIPFPERVDPKEIGDFDHRLRLWELAEHFGRRIRWKATGEYSDATAFADKARTTHLILEAFARETRAAGIQFVVLIVPSIHGSSWYDSDRIRASLGQSCTEFGIPHTDLSASLESWDAAHPERPTYAPRHSHWTPEGHALAARAILDLLGLPESPPEG